jgi:PBSX family phage portal protein
MPVPGRGPMSGRGYLQTGEADHPFAAGDVFHLMEPDINQEIYGLPEYLSALNSVWLNESATLFRRKYYLNGSHAGFIFYTTDAAQKQEDVDNLKQAFKDAKGPGNFKNLFLYAPNGKKDGVQLIPVSEVAAKDEFLNVKNVTRDDQLAAHRVPPQLMGIIPHNTGGFGDAEKAAAVFAANEVTPLQERMLEVNAWAGEEIIRFKPYALATTGAGMGAVANTAPASKTKP